MRIGDDHENNAARALRGGLGLLLGLVAVVAAKSILESAGLEAGPLGETFRLLALVALSWLVGNSMLSLAERVPVARKEAGGLMSPEECDRELDEIARLSRERERPSR
jgi:hypothetical protein